MKHVNSVFASIEILARSIVAASSFKSHSSSRVGSSPFFIFNPTFWVVGLSSARWEKLLEVGVISPPHLLVRPSSWSMECCLCRVLSVAHRGQQRKKIEEEWYHHPHQTDQRTQTNSPIDQHSKPTHVNGYFVERSHQQEERRLCTHVYKRRGEFCSSFIDGRLRFKSYRVGVSLVFTFQFHWCRVAVSKSPT